jgi:hypothetical protein
LLNVVAIRHAVVAQGERDLLLVRWSAMLTT